MPQSNHNKNPDTKFFTAPIMIALCLLLPGIFSFFWLFSTAEELIIFTPQVQKNRESFLSILWLTKNIYSLLGGLAILPLFFLFLQKIFRFQWLFLVAITFSLITFHLQYYSYEKLNPPLIQAGSACPAISFSGFYHLAGIVFSLPEQWKERENNERCNLTRSKHIGASWPELRNTYYTGAATDLHYLDSIFPMISSAVTHTTLQQKVSLNADKNTDAKIELVENILFILQKHNFRLKNASPAQNFIQSFLLQYLSHRENMLKEKVLISTTRTFEKLFHSVENTEKRNTSVMQKRINDAQSLWLSVKNTF